MEAAEGTAAGPEGTARGSERTEGPSAGCSAREPRDPRSLFQGGHQRWLLPRPPPQPCRSRSGTWGRIYGRAPRRGGSGRGGSGGAAGRAGAAGGPRCPAGAGAAAAGVRAGLHFPRLFFLPQQPALPPRRGEQPARCPEVPGAAGRGSISGGSAGSSQRRSRQLLDRSVRGHAGNYCGGVRAPRDTAGSRHRAGQGDTVRDRGTPRGGAGHRGAGTPRGAAGYGGGHPVALRACPSGKRRRARGAPACLPSGIPANAGVPGSSPSSPSLGNLCRDGSHSVAFCSRDKDLFLAVGQFGAWENGVGFRNISQGCRSFCSGFLSII